MPASRADSKALVALNQAFKDHVKDEERRFYQFAKTLEAVGALAPTLVRLETESKYISKSIGELVEKVGKQNGRVGKLERWRSWMLGILLIVGALSGYIIEHIVKGGVHP